MTNVLRLLCLVAVAVGVTHAYAKNFRVYIGTYSTHGSEGIYVCDFDPATGALKNKRVAAPFKSNDSAEFQNASFLAWHPDGSHLYAVSEVDNSPGFKGGAVIGFKVETATGQLTRTSVAPSGGRGPCYLSVDKTGSNVLVANYAGGTVDVLAISSDGDVLSEPSSLVIHPVVDRSKEKGVNRKRQESPHPHQIVLDAANRFAFVPDLGLDRVFIYRFDAGAHQIVPNDPPYRAVATGAGPRHLVFHPDGKFAYVVNELNSTVTAFHYDADKGALSKFQTISTLPKQGNAENTCAEIAVHPNGKFLYASNRGHDSIAMFSIDGTTGRLTALGHEPTGGHTPRHFAVDPSGKYLLASNQDSDSITVHRVNLATGRLEPTGHKLEIPSPVCVLFAAAK